MIKNISEQTKLLVVWITLRASSNTVEICNFHLIALGAVLLAVCLNILLLSGPVSNCHCLFQKCLNLSSC